MQRYTDEMKIETVLKKGTTVTMKVYINHTKQPDKDTSETGK